jgi:hypothetical protein
MSLGSVENIVNNAELRTRGMENLGFDVIKK